MKNFQKALSKMMMVFGFSAIVLTGCQIFSAKQPEPTGVDQVPQDRRIGTIQSLGGISTSNQGTDILTMDDGSTILLKSAAVNLDDEKYSGKKVEVSGVLTYTTDKKQIMEVESIDVLGDETTPTQQTASIPTWRDYVNESLGFQVKYRDDFTVIENGQTVTFTRPLSPEALMSATQEQTAPSSPASDSASSSSLERIAQGHQITVAVTPHGAGETLLKDFLNLNNDDSSTLLAAGITKSKIGLDGIDAYKEVDSHAENLVAFSFDVGSNFYKISYKGGNDSQNLEDQTVFYNFLGSFKLAHGSTASSQQTVGATSGSSVGTAMSNSQNDFGASNANSSSSASGTGTSSASASPNSSGSVSTSTGTAANGTSNSVTTSGNSGAVNPSSSMETGSPSTSTTSPSTANATPPDVNAQTTQEMLSGYSSFVSTGYKFSLQYPKKWYYGQTSSTDSSVVRRYDFGTQPVDQTPGNVNLDIVSGGIPAGSTTTSQGKTITETQNTDGTIAYYYKGQNGRIYRVSGPSAMQSSLLNMISTIQEQ